MGRMTIGQLAKQAEVKVETLRYYERCGLLPPPPRSPAGYRLYPAETVGWVRFIKRAQKLSFSLREIGELLSLRVSSGVTCAHIKAKAEEKVREIEARIADLVAMKRALEELIQACSGGGSTEECPILSALERKQTGGEAE